jgi:hypothetical protein
MTKELHNKKPGQIRAQSMIEYAVMITCIISALLAMQFYIKRGVQGRLRTTSDSLSSEHYDTSSIDSEITTKVTTDTTVTQKAVVLTDKNGQELKLNDIPLAGLESTVDLKETVKRTGSETIGKGAN